MSSVDNSKDLLDSRDVIARIAELETERADIEGDEELSAGARADLLDAFDCDWGDELSALRALADEAASSPDWPYGETLIRDSYFKAYAEELAEDIGAIGRDAQWPLSYIDWNAAADALKGDYTSVDFDGVTYWIRS